MPAKGKNAKLAQKSIKSKWQSIEKKITKVALNKQAVSQMENDMDRWLKDREKLSHRLDKLSQKKRRLLIEKGDSSLVEDMDDQIENLRANIKYLLEKILSMTVNQTCLATQKEGKIKEMDNRMQQALKQNSLHQQLLQHMIEQQDLEIYDLMLQNEDGNTDSDNSDSEAETVARSVAPPAPSLG